MQAIFKTELPSDKLLDAAIRRRRQLNEERNQRIFDPKVRTLGVNVQALEQQIKEKNDSKRTEKERDEAFGRMMRQTNTILEHLDIEAAERHRAHAKALNDFRNQHQKPNQRRDYDLYDPTALKKDKPARVDDEDERIGVSSLQRFEGEDLANEERRRLQKRQMETWAKESAWEKRMQMLKQQEEQRLYEDFQKDIDDKVIHLRQAVEEAKLQQIKADAGFNQHLAALKRQRELEQRRLEEELNRQEVIQQVNGEFLTERPDVFNIGAGHQVRVDLFKGITAEQKEHILRTQEQQRTEAQARREQQRREEEAASKIETANRRAALLLEREKLRQERAEAIRMREHNKQQGIESRKRLQHLDQVVYTNTPTKDYFMQFNTTSR
ncbi:RIB43A-domain-containing protein [Gaertneriomyces semiglobifer]|nr:RIB43A-domain-containing protein [Gaertneriomyces semiglobifer]